MLATLRTTAAAGTVARGRDRALGADELWQNAARVAAELPAPTPGSMVTFAFGKDLIENALADVRGAQHADFVAANYMLP